MFGYLDDCRFKYIWLFYSVLEIKKHYANFCHVVSTFWGVGIFQEVSVLWSLIKFSFGDVLHAVRHISENWHLPGSRFGETYLSEFKLYYRRVKYDIVHFISILLYLKSTKPDPVVVVPALSIEPKKLILHFLFLVVEQILPLLCRMVAGRLGTSQY